MAAREQIAAKKKEISGQISNLARTLALGVLAITWLILSGAKDAPEVVKAIPKWEAMFIAALCVVALIFDMSQYIAAYYQLEADLKRASKLEANKKKGIELKDHVYRRSQFRKKAFRIKVVVAGVAALWLVGVLAWAAISNAGHPQKKNDEKEPAIIIFLPGGQEIL